MSSDVASSTEADRPQPQPPAAGESRSVRYSRTRLVTTGVLGRLVHVLGVLFLVTLGATALTDLIPGSPGAAILGPTATDEQIAAFDAQYGYDDPLFQRYFEWLGNALSGDLGVSVQSKQPVLDTILSRFPVTLELTVLALTMSLLVAVPLAIWSASREGSALDRVTTASSSVLMSVPVFVAGVLLVYLFAVRTGWFPVSGWAPLSDGLPANLSFAFLPALALAIGEAPAFFRLLRTDMVANLHEDFVQTATTRGLPRRYVLLRHVLRPSSFSLLTVAAVSFGRLLAGSVVVESLFALPGLGNLALQSIPAKDVPMIQGLVVLVALAYVVINMLVDAAYAVLDPRIRAR